jgi:MGT family glycosyltransferase
MTRFAFVTWDGGGNVPPAVGIAQGLIERGHEVVFVGYEVQRQRFEDRHLPFVALRRTGSFDIYATADPAERIAGLTAHVWASPEHLDDVPDAVAATSSDILLIDFSMQGALASAMRSLVPVAVLAHSSIKGLIPPPESTVGAARLGATNRLREVAGLPQLASLTEAWTGATTLVTTIRALDPAVEGAEGPETANDSVHYLGPIFEALPDEPWDSPWAVEDDRPLVLVSFSTTGLWNQSGRVRNTLEALAKEPVRVLVSASQAMDLGRIPDNAAIRRFVPHQKVLNGAALTVTHAGHGTVAASLAHGVPILALPNLAADQPFLAARIEELGAGLGLPGDSEPAAIRAAARAVMAEPSYAAAAAELALAIRTAPGVGGAVAELERLAPVTIQ